MPPQQPEKDAASQPTVDHGSVHADADPALDKQNRGTITEVQGDAHFYETVSAAPLDPWSRTSLQLYMILLVAALNATASGFDGVGGQTLHRGAQDGSILTKHAVHLQLHQRHEPVPGVFPPHGAWFQHRHVSPTSASVPPVGHGYLHRVPPAASS